MQIPQIGLKFLNIIGCVVGIHLDRSCCHTRAKSRAHEIMRAQKNVQRPSQDNSKSCSVVTGSQLHCEVMCDWALN